jgi:pimeloyl-ACP methyl ester carboxylesterase
MQRAVLDGVTLEYEDSGSGEPVVFIHGAFIADAFRPLCAEPALADRHRLIGYRRRGHGGSGPLAAAVGVAEQADDCRRLLTHLDVRRAHVVGHFREVGADVAVDEFLRMRWPAYRETLERVVPGAFHQAVADAATFYEAELPAGLAWSFGEADAQRIAQPVLVVLGEESVALHPRFAETYSLLLDWLPKAEGFLLPGAAHFLQVENPRGIAEALAAFYARHPLRGT